MLNEIVTKHENKIKAIITQNLKESLKEINLCTIIFDYTANHIDSLIHCLVIDKWTYYVDFWPSRKSDENGKTICFTADQYNEAFPQWFKDEVDNNGGIIDRVFDCTLDGEFRGYGSIRLHNKYFDIYSSFFGFRTWKIYDKFYADKLKEYGGGYHESIKLEYGEYCTTLRIKFQLSMSERNGELPRPKDLTDD